PNSSRFPARPCGSPYRALRFIDLPVLFEPSEITQIEQRIEALKNRGGEDNIVDSKLFTLEDGGQEFTLGVYLQRASSPHIRVRIKSKRDEAPACDSTSYIRGRFM
ncbi:MAG TPA: hypothetical protein VI233_12215, partial [Puia sp.]